MTHQPSIASIYGKIIYKPLPLTPAPLPIVNKAFL